MKTITHFIQIEVAKAGLAATLLVKHPDTGELYVNFDPQVMTLIRETECMARLGLDIPPAAQNLRAKQQYLKEKYNNLMVGEATHV